MTHYPCATLPEETVSDERIPFHYQHLARQLETRLVAAVDETSKNSAETLREILSVCQRLLKKADEQMPPEIDLCEDIQGQAGMSDSRLQNLAISTESEKGTNAVSGAKALIVQHLETSLDFMCDLEHHESKEMKDWMQAMRTKMDNAIQHAHKLATIDFAANADECATQDILGRSADRMSARRLEREQSKRDAAWNSDSMMNALHRHCHNIVNAGSFDALCATVIVANALVMGISADYYRHHLDEPPNKLLGFLELGFFSFYTVEISLRVFVSRKKFLTGIEYHWNCFDLALIFLSLWDQIEFLFLPEGSSSPLANISFMRLLRLFKMAKLFRMFRLMKMFKELRIMLNSIMGSIVTLLWACLFIVILNYMASICFVNVCTTFLQEAKDQIVDPIILAQIDKYWSSVIWGMDSLFAACTGGSDWKLPANSLLEIGIFYYILYVTYIAFFLIVIMNTLTSLFVEEVMENSARDEAFIIESEMKNQDFYCKQLESFFSRIDDDGEGTISYDEFCRHADDPQVLAFASSLQIDVSDAKTFFGILSNNGELEVDIEAFVSGCIKLKGAAKSVDLMSLFQFAKRTHTLVDDIWSVVRSERQMLATSSAQAAQQAHDLKTALAALHCHDHLYNPRPHGVQKAAASNCLRCSL